MSWYTDIALKIFEKTINNEEFSSGIKNEIESIYNTIESNFMKLKENSKEIDFSSLIYSLQYLYKICVEIQNPTETELKDIFFISLLLALKKQNKITNKEVFFSKNKIEKVALLQKKKEECKEYFKKWKLEKVHCQKLKSDMSYYQNCINIHDNKVQNYYKQLTEIRKKKEFELNLEYKQQLITQINMLIAQEKEAATTLSDHRFEKGYTEAVISEIEKIIKEIENQYNKISRQIEHIENSVFGKTLSEWDELAEKFLDKLGNIDFIDAESIGQILTMCESKEIREKMNWFMMNEILGHDNQTYNRVVGVLAKNGSKVSNKRPCEEIEEPVKKRILNPLTVLADISSELSRQSNKTLVRNNGQAFDNKHIGQTFESHNHWSMTL